MTRQEKQLWWQRNAARLRQLEDDVVLNQDKIRFRTEGQLCQIGYEDSQMLVD